MRSKSELKPFARVSVLDGECVTAEHKRATVSLWELEDGTLLVHIRPKQGSRVPTMRSVATSTGDMPAYHVQVEPEGGVS